MRLNISNGTLFVLDSTVFVTRDWYIYIIGIGGVKFKMCCVLHCLLNRGSVSSGSR